MATYPILSICSGGGGLDAGIRLALPESRVICYVEREVTEAEVLGIGIEAGWLDDAPIWSDLLTFDGPSWRGKVDGIVGGFPCQPHSYAGKRLGEHDERNLWPAVARLVFDVAPEFCFFENVPGILPFYWSHIRPDLCALGYEVEEGIFSAAEVGAPHLRERLFILAHRNDSPGSPEQGQQQGQWANVLRRGGEPVGDATDERHERGGGARRRSARLESSSRVMGDTERTRLQGRRLAVETGPAFPPGPGDTAGWREWLDAGGAAPAIKPGVRSGTDGLARADWLRVYGNGVVPVVAAHAFLTLAARMEER